MIQVNLLPPEFRKVDGTPVARFVALTMGVFLTATAMSVWGYVHFGMLAEVHDRRAQKEEELVSLQALATRSQALLSEYKEYERRRATIEEIGQQRVLWSRKLDQMADLIHNKGSDEPHLVWLSSVRSEAPRKAGSPGTLKISGWSGGEELARLSDFNKGLKSDEEFFADFIGIDPPRGDRVEFPDGRLPAAAWRFDMAMDLAPTGTGTKEKQ